MTEIAEIEEDDLDAKLLAELSDNVQSVDGRTTREETEAHVTHVREPKLVEQSAEVVTPNRERPRRHRLSARTSGGPDALSAWFRNNDDPALNKHDRRKTTTDLNHEAPPLSTAPATTKTIRKAASTAKTNGSVSPPQLKRYSSSQGLRTSLTYLTPLTNLEMHLSNPGVKVDVLAIVTETPSEAKRAKLGPRDWYVVLHVTDPAFLEQQDNKSSRGGAVLSQGDSQPISREAANGCHEPDKEEREDMRVEMYRPWKASLPAAAPGDVILLRNFGVRSRNRRTYLLSGQESAWCVFRAGAEDNDDADSDARRRPSWARRGIDLPLREEVRGPPVEVGPEERDKAEELRGWWDVVVMMKDKGKKRATL